MKKLIISTFAVLALLVSCNRNYGETINTEPVLNTICGVIDEDATKTTYSADGTFSWVSGDRVSYVVQSSSTDKHNLYTYSTSGEGPTATFTGTTPTGEWSAVGYAFYPNYDSKDAYVNNQLAVSDATTLQGILSSSIKAKADRLEGIIPMVGQKTTSTESMENYKFYNATGVLKISFASLPATATEIRLAIPDNSYPLSGTFNIKLGGDGKPVIKASEVASANYQKNLSFAFTSAADAFYFPIPVGTIPAGKLTVTVHDGTNALYMVTNKKEIVLERGRVEELPTITVPSVSVKIGGTALAPTATFYFSGDVNYVKYKTRMSDALTDLNTGTISSSGASVNLENSFSYQYYIGYQAYNSSNETIGELVKMRYYAITSTAASEVCKQFTSAIGDIGLTDKKTPSYASGDFGGANPTITIAASDDSRKGNIMVTEFCGVSGKTYGYYAQYANSTTKSSAPQITIQNVEGNPFCTVASVDYYLHEYDQTYVRFAVKTTDVPTVSAYGQNADFCGWIDGTLGLSDWAGTQWGPWVNYFYDKAE